MSYGYERRPGSGGGGGGRVGGGQGAPGKRALTDRMEGPLRLRQLLRTAQGTAAIDITRTVEYRDLVDPALVWRWGFKVTPEEAHLTCSLMLAAMRAGELVDWQMEARRYLLDARRQLGAPAPAAPVADVAQGDDGQACAVTEPELDGGVCEAAPPDAATVDVTEAPPELVVQHDPPPADLPPGNVDELIRLAREIAEDLDDAFELEARIAKRLLELAYDNRGLLITLGLLAGGYMVAVRYIGGRVVISWAAGAAGMEFERRAARAAVAAAELEANLREQSQIVAQLVDTSAGNGGVHWKGVRGERWSKRAIAQVDPHACGAACGEMMLDARGVAHPSQQEMIFRMRGSEALDDVPAHHVAEILGQVDPDGEWLGGYAGPGLPDRRRVAESINGLGSWVAEMKNPDGGHFVVVEGMSGDTVKILDPWRWPNADKTAERPRGCGTAYSMSWDDFFAVWNGTAVWCRARRQR